MVEGTWDLIMEQGMELFSYIIATIVVILSAIIYLLFNSNSKRMDRLEKEMSEFKLSAIRIENLENQLSKIKNPSNDND